MGHTVSECASFDSGEEDLYILSSNFLVYEKRWRVMKLYLNFSTLLNVL